MFIHEVFKGRYVSHAFGHRVPELRRLNALMIVGPGQGAQRLLAPPVSRSSGRVWIGVLPNEHSNLIGLSKYARICDWIMSRPQIQEEAVTMLANELQERVKPDGLADRDGGRPLLHALARRQGRRVDDDQQRDARRFLKDRQPAARVLSLLSKKL
jgi:GTP cyclohydrolase I